MGKREKNEKNSFLVVVIITVLIGIIALGIVYSYNIVEKDILIKEVNYLVENKDLSADRIYMDKLKTKGNYAKVEEAIKTYLNDCGIESKKILEILGDQRLTNLLSIDNFENDGKEFTESFNYIDTTSKELEESSNKFTNLLTKEETIKYIQKYNLSDRYNKLFEDLIFDEETEKEMQNSRENFAYELGLISEKLNVTKDILSFLKDNKDSWEIQDDSIIFENTTLLTQYNEFVQKLK